MIVTEYNPPAIPLRSHDWRATWHNPTPYLPGAIDPPTNPDNGEYVSAWGPTEKDAVLALIEQI